VLLVATLRPGSRVSWLDRSYGTQITLSPLTAADSARLVEAVVREQPLDADVSRAILRRGEGPFFLEELARAVIERRAGTDIPDTVQGVIMARIDRLADMPKRLLQTASIGREVPLGLLQQVWNGPADFDARLMELCRLEEAAGFAERGIQTATRVGYAYAMGFAHRIAGRIARDRGSVSDAARQLGRSLEIFERASAVFEAARTRLDLAAIAAEHGDCAHARNELTAAARTFQSLGATAYGSRAAALAASLGLDTET
jgi:hypothetical protein